jgi:hypothetical protein
VYKSSKRILPSFCWPPQCAGYPRWLSGDLKDLTKVAERTQTHLFPGVMNDRPWEDVQQFKRYQLSFPFYPFRTLCPRELANLKITQKHEFDSSSPIIPANTQINIVFNRRNQEKLINYILPFNLNMALGTSNIQLTDDERQQALTFSVLTPPAAGAAAGAVATRQNYVISQVAIVIKDMYLQVRINN